MGEKKYSTNIFIDSIYGRALLEVCSNDFVFFYDWVECHVIQRIDANMENVYWVDEKGYLLSITSDNPYYIFKYNREDAFDLVHEIKERDRTRI
jgi:coatomer subunit beta'